MTFLPSPDSLSVYLLNLLVSILLGTFFWGASVNMGLEEICFFFAFTSFLPTLLWKSLFTRIKGSISYFHFRRRLGYFLLILFGAFILFLIQFTYFSIEAQFLIIGGTDFTALGERQFEKYHGNIYDTYASLKGVPSQIWVRTHLVLRVFLGLLVLLHTGLVGWILLGRFRYFDLNRVYQFLQRDQIEEALQLLKTRKFRPIVKAQKQEFELLGNALRDLNQRRLIDRLDLDQYDGERNHLRNLMLRLLPDP